MTERRCLWCFQPIWRDDRTDHLRVMHAACRTQFEDATFTDDDEAEVGW